MRPLLEWSSPVQGRVLVPDYPLQRTGTTRPHSRIWCYLPNDGVSDPFAQIYRYGTDAPILGYTSANRHTAPDYPRPHDSRCIRPP